MTEEFLEENVNKIDTEEEEIVPTPHLAMDESNHVTTPQPGEATEGQTINWLVDHGLWKDLHGIWHDIHGRWRDHGGVWHDAPYISSEYPQIHFFDHALNHIINHIETQTETDTPLTPIQSTDPMPKIQLSITIIRK